MPNKNTKFKQLSKEDRIRIEVLNKQHCSQVMIANEIKCHKSTISRELNNPKNCVNKYVNVIKYNAQVAWENHVKNKSFCGANCKAFVFNDQRKYIEEQVIKKKWSPRVAINTACITQFTDRTVYNWISKNQTNIKPHHLRYSLRRKQYRRQEIKDNKKKMGKSITERNEIINTRKEFGHWEADCIIGKHGQALLVMQERKTRFFLMKRIQKHNSMYALYQARLWVNGNFKSITCDNGYEFTRFNELPADIYFTHPFAPYEKGSIENLNGIIRRFIPKGTSLTKYSDDFIQNVCDIINETPREILGFKTPKMVYSEAFA